MNVTIIKENWAAIEDVEKQVKELHDDPEAGFNATTLFFGERMLMIPCMYRGKKGKKGQEIFTEKYKEVMIAARYCPFSGKPLYDDVEITPTK
jgi:hypothetical protein